MARYSFLLLLMFLLSPDAESQDNFRLTYPAKFRIEQIAPVRIVKTGPKSWLADFGKDAFGTIILKINPTKPDTLVIHLGEKLSSANSIDRNPGGTIRYQKILMSVTPGEREYVLQLPPDKRNTTPPAVALPPAFGVITPFRYCEIENLETELTKEKISQKTFFYIFDENASMFTSSDTILNRVWDLCKYSIKATSFCGLYVDGDRERIPYEADAFINQLSHYAVDSEYSLAKRTNEYFIAHPTWPTEWILHTVLLFYYDYLYTGDATLLRKYYNALKEKTLISLEREDGLISSKSEKVTDGFMASIGFKDTKQRIRDIVDWPPAQKDTGWKLATSEGERDGYDMVPVNTVVNAFHYYNLRLMFEIAGWLGKKEDSDFFLKRSETVRSSINTKLFDSKKGIYTDGEGSSHSSLHSNMFPLAFGLVAEENIKSVVSFIKSRGMACSVYGSQFLLDGLYGVNESEYALSLLNSTGDRSWWNMIRSGSTISMEAWDMKYKPNSDWNHAWGASPANIISRRLWGIRPVSPGFRKAVIDPQMGNLTSSEIKVPTVNGPIKATFKKTGPGSSLYTITLPAGIEADFAVKSGTFRRVHVNKKKTKPVNGLIKLNAGYNEIELLK